MIDVVGIQWLQQPQKFELVEKRMKGNWGLKAKVLAAKVDLSKSSVHRILHGHLNINKISEKLFPKLLVQNEHRMECCK